MSNKQKQTALDLEQKISIIKDIEAGNKQAAVAAALNLPKQTVWTADVCRVFYC